ncbi:MAG: ankyrin repeat domain-containing protein [Bacteroidales bacterium]|nr:ankyrin repeat domain-containing protein [Bacteroidales bacterium]
MNIKFYFSIIFLLLASQFVSSQNRCERLFPSVKNNDSLTLVNLLDSGANINQIDENGATPLMWATYNKNMNIVKLLIDRNADFTIRGAIYEENDDFYYGSLLAISAGKNDFELTKYFVENLKLDINQHEYSLFYKSDTGWTPLQWAVSRENEEITNYLLLHGADVNICDHNGYAPLFLSLIKNNYELTKLLIDNGADLNYLVPSKNEDYGGFGAMHFASIVDSAENIIQLLLDNDVDINQKIVDSVYYGGYTALHFSILIENIDNFKFLILKGADVNIKNADGYTPLLYAIDYELDDFITELLKNEADVNITGANNISPLLLASQLDLDFNIYEKLIDLGADINATIADTADYWDNPGYTALHFTCSEMDKYRLAELLLHKGADVNAKDVYSNTPLQLSVSDDHNFALSKLLIENGALVTDKNIDGQTPLHLACMYNEDTKTVDLLIQNGAELNVKDNNGWTPVMYAAFYGNIEIMKFLMDKGADIELKNDDDFAIWDLRRADGSTVLFNLVKEGDFDLVKLFVKKGADINAVNSYGETPIIIAKEYEHKKIEKYLKRKGAKLTGTNIKQ